jgi:hypothetical protein
MHDDSRRSTPRSDKAAIQPVPLLILALLLTAYAVPWMNTPSIGALTVHAYDLAEWVSIHPAVRAEPLLLTALLLRLPLACIGLWTGWIGSCPRWLRVLGVCVIAVALLPPFEFITSAPADPNYQQQFVLAVTAWLGGIIGVFVSGRAAARVMRVVPVALLALAGCAALLGSARALIVMAGLGVDMTFGWGTPLFVLACIIGIGWLAAVRPRNASR